MTRTNQELLELPDHGHYVRCLARKDEIDRNAIRMLRYTLMSCGIFLLFTIYTLRFAVISWIPSLMGESTEVAPLFTQMFIIILIGLMSAMNCGKYKIFGLVLFGFYIALAIFGVICMGSNTADIISLIIGSGGIATSFRSVSDYLDWNQLMETEGFPHFNLRFAEQIENPEYVPVHKGDNAADHMSGPEKADDLVFSSSSESAMPALSVPKPAMKGDPEYVFRPAGGKHCSMSESPIKTA